MRNRSRLARWSASQSPTSLLVVRVLAVANIGVLAVAGAIAAVFVAPVAGYVIAALLWSVAVLLVLVLPHTNPRRDGSRW